MAYDQPQLNATPFELHWKRSRDRYLARMLSPTLFRTSYGQPDRHAHAVMFELYPIDEGAKCGCLFIF
jgi:hypothetical protein